MPPNSPRPRPARTSSAPRRKRSLAGVSRPTRRQRSPDDHSALLYWIAGGLVVLLALIIAIDAELPRIQASLHPAGKQPLAREYQPASPEKRKPLPIETPPKKSVAQILPAPKPPLPKPPLVVAPEPASPPVAENGPPLVQPMPLSPTGVPARALPLDPNVLTTERIAAYQVALERIHFSCGFIDGDQGMRTQRMLRAYQASRGLPITGFLDPATRAAIGEPGEPFLTYTVTPADVAAIMPKPPTWRAKAQAKRLGYNTIWELLAEKFHCTRAYLKALNPGVIEPTAGLEMIGPKVFPAAPIPPAASLRVLLGETSIEALDASGRVIGFFPCSIAKDKNKRPNGALFVKSVVPDPDYTFDPALFADAAREEGLTHKMVLPPGPRNPVGTTWIGLSLPGYGIHGTPEPENISRTQSHGCFRLANWNAETVLKMVRVGTPVEVQP
jgi:lipoprotein-anchoring transpeptidase ErfK/SrfK